MNTFKVHTLLSTHTSLQPSSSRIVQLRTAPCSSAAPYSCTACYSSIQILAHPYFVCRTAPYSSAAPDSCTAPYSSYSSLQIHTSCVVQLLTAPYRAVETRTLTLVTLRPVLYLVVIHFSTLFLTLHYNQVNQAPTRPLLIRS